MSAPNADTVPTVLAAASAATGLAAYAYFFVSEPIGRLTQL